LVLLFGLECRTAGIYETTGVANTLEAVNAQDLLNFDENVDNIFRDADQAFKEPNAARCEEGLVT
jgi:hypothetical protein